MRRNKFRAVRTNGFASKLESATYDLLKLREAAGEIKDISCQAKVLLSDAEISYKTDFKFTEIKTGEDVWVEAKGVQCGEWRLKKKLWSCYGPGRLLIYMGSYTRVTLVEELVPEPKAQICRGCGAKVEAS